MIRIEKNFKEWAIESKYSNGFLNDKWKKLGNKFKY